MPSPIPMNALTFLLGLSTSLTTMAVADGTTVEAVETKAGWQINQDGVHYAVRGVGGGESDLARVRSSGATTIRTWGIDPDTNDLLDAAHAEGLTVLVGLWMGHIGDGFDYLDPDAVEAQEAALLALAMPLKDHPALFGWGVGNEVEFGHDVPEVWEAIGSLASAVKAMDPDHPTVAVTAELGVANEQRLAAYCPDVDIWGINAYGGLATLPARLTTRGWTGPYLITEYAHQGDWESDATSWGAPVEPTSREKALAYERRWLDVAESDPRCVGSFAFVWRPGRTPSDTWFPMLSWDGRGTEATDRMQEIWTGTVPANRAPSVGGIVGGITGTTFSPGEPMTASLAAVDPEGQPITVEWFLAKETLNAKGRWTGTSATVQCLDGTETSLAMFAPRDAGAYRLFAYASDGGPGVGTASAPFLVGGAGSGFDATPTFAVSDHFSPTGWMGDIGSLGLSTCVGPNTTCGGICRRFEWAPSSPSWFGVLWQYPPNNWGSMPGLSIAPGADRVGFYAWSEPASSATFRVGGGNDGFSSERTIDLTTSPTWHELAVDPFGYDDVATGLGIVVSGSTPRTIWVSDASWMAQSPEICPGDINEDGFIGPGDLGLLLGAWNEPAATLPLADLNDDGTINSADLGILAGLWGECVIERRTTSKSRPR